MLFERFPRLKAMLRPGVAVALISLVASAYADWRVEGKPVVNAGELTTITLVREGTSPRGNAPPLQIVGSSSPDLLLPETVLPRGNKAELGVFARRTGTAAFTLHDGFANSTTAIQLNAVASTSSKGGGWRPYLQISGEEGKPVLMANRASTVTLELEPGTGPMPPTTHITATDHRGRVVMALFYSTLQLAAGTETFVLPAAGEYELTVRLLAEPTDKFPRAVQRKPAPIEFGKTIAHNEVEELASGITTQTVVGVRVALENLPTTATVAGMDKLRVVAFGLHSKEIQRNKWPFVISGSDLISMPVDERNTTGELLLRWQRRLGSSFAPVKINWSDIQRDAGGFNWSSLNGTLPVYRRRLVRPLLTVTGKAAWNDEIPTETSATLANWQTFIAKLSERYTPLMWNLQCWEKPEKTWSDPGEYAELLLATADGLQIRDGKKIDAPPLVMGSMSSYSPDFINQALTSSTRERISGIAFDLFPLNPLASPDDNNFSQTVTAAAKLLSRAGHPGTEIWLTGTAWPSGPGGVPLRLQANYMVRAHALALAAGAYKVTWNDLYDKKPGKSALPRKVTGLLDTDLMPKPAGVAYNIMTYVMAGATSGSISRQGSATITSFNIPQQSNKWAGNLYVAWTHSPDQVQTVQLDMKRGGGVYAFDYLGAEISTTKVAGEKTEPIAGTYTVPVGYDPVFIWDAGKPDRHP